LAAFCAQIELKLTYIYQHEKFQDFPGLYPGLHDKDGKEESEEQERGMEDIREQWEGNEKTKRGNKGAYREENGSGEGKAGKKEAARRGQGIEVN
jgi:hypothetical protein